MKANLLPDKADGRTRLTVAYACMALSSVLALVVFLTSCLVPVMLTRVAILLVVLSAITVSLVGFGLVVAMLRKELRRRKDLDGRLVRLKRLSALGQMTSSIAHDFNNSLMPIAGLTEFLLTNRDRLDDRKELVESLTDIRESAEHARQTVLKLREFYKSCHNLNTAIIVVPGEVFEQALAECPALVARQAAGGSCVLEIRREFGEVPPVRVDGDDLKEALVNVLTNAVEAMPVGGLLTCRLLCEKNMVCFEVADTGGGMSVEVQAHCFEPLYSTKSGQGAGAGLAVAHGIVRRHGGSMDVRSNPGAGAAFTIRMPVSPAV